MVQSGKNVLGTAQRGRRQFAVKHPSNPTTFGDLGTRRSLSELVLSTCLGCVESPMSECGGCSVKRRVVALSLKNKEKPILAHSRARSVSSRINHGTTTLKR
jgi:hypothetical protein